MIFIPFIFTSSCFPGKLPTSILNVDCIPCTASLSPVPVAKISLVLTNKSKGESKSWNLGITLRSKKVCFFNFAKHKEDDRFHKRSSCKFIGATSFFFSMYERWVLITIKAWFECPRIRIQMILFHIVALDCIANLPSVLKKQRTG